MHAHELGILQRCRYSLHRRPASHVRLDPFVAYRRSNCRNFSCEYWSYDSATLPDVP